MSNLNTSTSTNFEKQNNSQGIIQSNIFGLLEDSVAGIFGKLDFSGNDFSSSVNPDQYNEYRSNPVTFLKKVKIEMKSILEIENKKSYNTTDVEIDALTDQKIKNMILIHTSKFVSLRKRVILKAKGLDKSIAQDHVKLHLFEQNIEKISQEELEKLSWNPRKLLVKIREIFPNDDPTKENDIFKNIFYDIDTVHITPKERAILDRLIQDWERGNSLKESDLELVLRVYRSTSTARKKELLQSLNVEYSLGFALQNKWITESDIDNILIQTFPEIGILNSSEEKKNVRDIVLKNGDFYITIDNIGGDPNRFFEGDNRKMLAKILEKEWAHGPNISEASESGKNSEITQEITDEFNLKNPDGTGDYSYHQAFIDIMKRKSINAEGKEKIQGIENLKDNAVITYKKDGKSRYIRIKKTGAGIGGILPLDVLNNTESGVQIANITGAKEGTLGSEQLFEVSYEQLEKVLSEMDDARVYSENEFSELITSDPNQATDGKILDVSQAESDRVNKDNLLLKLNEIDSDGAQYGFEVGTYFTASASEESKDGKSQKIAQAIWKVANIHDDMIDIQYEKGNIDPNIPIQNFYEVLKESGFKRIHSINDDVEFLSVLKGDADRGLFENTKLDHGHMSFVEKDDKGKEHKYVIHNFVGEGDEHIRLGEIHNGLVSFGEYSGEDVEKAKKHIEKEGEDEANGFYKWRTLTYGAFLEYLKKNKLKASKDDKLVSHAHHEHEHGTHAHMHGSFLSKIFKSYNFHDLFKAGELMLHSIEHALEKGSKANAARAALGMGKFLHLPASIQAQLTADIVDGNKELIEKYTKKLQNLNGPIGRAKALHAAHNSDARPEEVMAAIYHMLNAYGQLYAEDPEMLNQEPPNSKHGQGSDSFLYALINACGFKGADLEDMKERAYKKGAEETSPDKCTEEGAIYGFMKMMDGSADKYPLAAALIKASGGPGGFEKAWRTEGAENARQKGERQAGAVPNQDARLKKVIGYMKTGEYNSAVGGLKKMMGKNPAAKYRAGDFVFLVGGFTKMLSNDARQKLFNENQGSSFHACAFVRHDQLVDTYIATVRLALADMRGGYLEKFEAIMKGAPYQKKMNINGKEQSFVEHLSDFWQDTYNEGLHDRLQGHNNWLMEAAKNNETVRSYVSQLDGFHGMQLSGHTPSLEGNSDNSVYSQGGYAEANIFRYDKETNTRSIKSMLTKLKFHGGGIDSMKKMDDEVTSRVWKPIIDTLNKTRDDEGGTEEQKKKQFLKTRSELIEYFGTEFSTTTKEWNDEKVRRQLNSQPYFQELQNIGIDPRGLFPHVYPQIQFEEQDYRAWINRSSSGKSSSVIQSRPNVQAEFLSVKNRVNNNLSSSF